MTTDAPRQLEREKGGPMSWSNGDSSKCLGVCFRSLDNAEVMIQER